MFVFLLALVLAKLSYGDNRSDMYDIAAGKLGVTFYTSAEMQTIAKCAEPQVYKTPNNNTAITSAAKNCILNNSGNKAVQALSLYNNANSCLDPEALDDVATKLTPPLAKLAQPLVKKIKNALSDCKANNQKTGDAKQEACIQKCYGVAKAAITLDYVDGICKKLVNQNVTKQEWGCAQKYLPSVVTTSKYNCSKIVKS
uniref:DUF19 domain-containing protein n=2 Tax=Caenorhabditis japonica TaxID=281687 RepID=A0A8R1DG95_CAEJA